MSLDRQESSGLESYQSYGDEDDWVDEDDDDGGADDGDEDEGPDDMASTGERTEVLFQAMSPDMIVEKQLSQIATVKELMEVSTASARCLLQAFKWDLDKLQNRYFEDSEKVFREAGLAVDAEQLDKSLTKADNENECFMCGALSLEPGQRHCLICHTDCDAEETFELLCRHVFCRDCWGQYLAIQIKEEGHSRDIVCPSHRCDIIVDEFAVRDLMEKANPEVYRLYTRRLVEAYVDDNPYLKWCPAPGCGNAVMASLSRQSLPVRCSCGYQFCFACLRESHMPASCAMLKEWEKKCKDDSETCNWISANTKDCPKCGAAIEKNGGCNHINCKKCGHHFCWVCLDDFDWKTYNHSCNRHKKETTVGAGASARQSLNRYLHYYTRYTNHRDSLKLEDKLRAEVARKMIELQDGAAWIDVQFMKQATDQLLVARQILSNTYVLGYYMPKTEAHKVSLFEFLQEELEKNTERLSGLLEQEAGTINRQEVLNYTQNVRTRIDNLLRDVDGEGMIMEAEPVGPMLGASASGAGSAAKKSRTKGGRRGKDAEGEGEEAEEADGELQHAIIESMKDQ